MVGPRKFLVVDEASTVTQRTTTYLEQSGISGDHILEAWSGEGALDRYEDHRPEVVILSLELPDADGHEVADEIMDRNPRAHVVLCTVASRDDARVRAAVRNGAQAVLRKPLHVTDVRELLAVLERESPGRTRIPPPR